MILNVEDCLIEDMCKTGSTYVSYPMLLDMREQRPIEVLHVSDHILVELRS